MLHKLDGDIYLGVIALFVLLLAGGIAFMYKANSNEKARDVLPPAHKPLPALPMGAASAIIAPHEFRGSCHFCHPVANVPLTIPGLVRNVPTRSASASVPVPSWFLGPRGGAWAQRRPHLSADATQAEVQRPTTTGGATGLLTPAEQNAASKMMVEGHWLGMETMDLTPALRKIYEIPADVAGVIVDEITLESAESGLLAGDVITSIQGRRTRDLDEFLQATQAVGEQKKARVIVNRLGRERRFSLVAKNAGTLGFAQMEGAQPIQPGALSPHRDRRRACTDCHVIMTTGGQLPVDAGDILPSPPPITANAKASHEYRGVCSACHQITATAGTTSPTTAQPAVTPVVRAFSGPPIAANAAAPHRYRGECSSCHVIQ